MKKLIIVGIAIIIIFIIGGIWFVEYNDGLKSVSEIEEETEDENGYLPWMVESSKAWEEAKKKYFVSVDMIKELTKSNPDWTKIDIPEESLERIKEKYPNGIFEGEEYDEVELKEDYNSLVQDSEMGEDTFVLIAKKGKKVVEYEVRGECGDVLSKDRFGIYTVIRKDIYNDDGDRIKYPMDEEHWISNLQKIALQDNEEVGKSEDFYERYPNFTGILNFYKNDDISGIEIDWLSNQNSFIDKTLYCNVYYPHYSENYNICIQYDVDENSFIKEYQANILSKEEYYSKKYDNFSDPYNGRILLRLIYKKRDWSKLPLSKQFLEKYDNTTGIFGNLSIVYFSGINLNSRMGDKCALELDLLDGTKKYVGLTYKIVDNKIDDIEIKYLPDDDYTKYTKKEIYAMF
jgi:uncharacterized protein YpmB